LNNYLIGRIFQQQLTVILKDTNMRRFLLSLSIALLSLGVMAPEAEAKRLGGGGSSGMKRDVAPRNNNQAVPPSQQATPNNAAAAAPGAAAAAAPKRSWMGPIAGLAAGLGLAALASHLGFGEELANFMMIALMAIAAIFVIRLLLRKFGPQSAANATARDNGMQFAGAGAHGQNLNIPASSGSGGFQQNAPQSFAAPQAPALSLPAGFDAAAFERIAKMIFIRMQAANDSADLNDLRAFTTPEMFAAAKQDLLDRGNAAQQTDVVKLDAEVVDFAQEPSQQIVSVRFHGLIREEKDAAAAGFDEIWHLVKPTDGSREWAIAGIAQTAA
jgi:predicted lipid-binding transport protein (Tim44 family)